MAATVMNESHDNVDTEIGFASSEILGVTGTERNNVTVTPSGETSETISLSSEGNTASMEGVVEETEQPSSVTNGRAPLGVTIAISLQANNPLARKLNKILGLRLDQDKELVEAMKSLSKFYGENNLKTRRNLRSDIERRCLEVNYDFLGTFSLVKESLDQVQKEVLAMRQCCDEMNNRLQAAKTQTAEVVDTTTKLQEKAARVVIREEVAQEFISKLQLTSEELVALKGPGGSHGLNLTRIATDSRSQLNRNSAPRVEAPPVEGEAPSPSSIELDAIFFQALERAKQIHADCKLLMRSQHQTIALEIMDSMSLLVEMAYERVYRWTRAECRGLSRESPEITPIFHRALHTLRDRPALFRYCCDEIGTVRRTTVIRQFIDALAIGGPGGFPRPIEMHSHDPLRYVSDMLAWLHQTVAAEQELVSMLLLPPQAKDIPRYTSDSSAPFSRRFTREGTLLDSERTNGNRSSLGKNGSSWEDKERDKIKDELKELLNRVMEGTCRPFKSRLDQVLWSDPGVVVCYKLASLLHFYAHTIGIHLPPSACLHQTISEGCQTAFKVFMDSLKVHASTTLSDVQLPPADLSPSVSILQTLAMLKELVASYSGILVVQSPPEANEGMGSIATVLSAVLDPLLQLAQAQASSMPPANQAVYMLNCLTSIQTTLGLYEFTTTRLEGLESQIDTFLMDLVYCQASFVMTKTGLSSKLQILTRLVADNNTAPLSECLGMEASSLKETMRQFDTFLST
eukprot:Ihof_evm13s68 gene=Ihof_evmTU13s68